MASFRVIPTEFVSDGELKGNFLAPETENSFPIICKFHGSPGSPDQMSGVASRLAGWKNPDYYVRLGFGKNSECYYAKRLNLH